MKKTVAIFGATGAQGAPVVKAAVARGLKVRAVARDLNKITDMHSDAEAFSATLDDVDAIAQALAGVDAAFLHLPMPVGPDDAQTWLTNFMIAAKRAALPLLVYTTSGPAGDRYPESMMVQAGTAGMQALLDSEIATIVLQPGIYLENLRADMIVPKLDREGILDYPPLDTSTQIQWTSHHDQALVAAAALTRPDLAGNAYEIGTKGSLTGEQLAKALTNKLGKPVTFAPLTPAEFGQRVGDAIASPGAAFALTDLYTSLAKMRDAEMQVNLSLIEKTFDVCLTSVEEHIARW
ncbi:hypothetical protein TW85_01735 [Marinomonas sp. S3726]|uniref:SDR family oxidoreductase n=1 Tax=Marinomonas sp. S3726 TaxID=579484 RepID=UPI0005FA22D5|nr:NmrA family NAD(P)-binding protein [Marinomonas sp. S3726]KJZ15650.1 hypothetical protein TW85_01735 [Marinomonas sp. S3726]